MPTHSVLLFLSKPGLHVHKNPSFKSVHLPFLQMLGPCRAHSSKATEIRKYAITKQSRISNILSHNNLYYLACYKAFENPCSNDNPTKKTFTHLNSTQFFSTLSRLINKCNCYNTKTNYVVYSQTDCF